MAISRVGVPFTFSFFPPFEIGGDIEPVVAFDDCLMCDHRQHDGDQCVAGVFSVCGCDFDSRHDSIVDKAGVLHEAFDEDAPLVNQHACWVSPLVQCDCRFMEPDQSPSLHDTGCAVRTVGFAHPADCA